MQYPFSRQEDPGRIQDIMDGKAYRDLMRPGGFLSVPEHTGLILCSDGVQLFKSCGQSLWPIMFSVTSLPPSKRMNADNIILAGVWQGIVKPNMATILQPVLDKVHDLHCRGVLVETPIGRKTIKVQLLLGVFDLPAKAMATNFTQYNGKYGCNYCLDEGQHISRRRLFLPTDPHTPRSSVHLRQSTLEAQQQGTPVFGVKGPSVLSSYINILTDVPVDYMHAVLEGVTKTLISYWLDSKNHRSRFYLGLRVTAIDSKLLCIRPPPEIRRSPRLISTYRQWKASEYRAWLLYYCLPVLHGILPSDYVHHLSLLVSSVHILISDSITNSSLCDAQSLLESFYSLLPNLYPDIMCGINFHSLIHLPTFVKHWGPLWCYSAFGYENMNGRLRSHCHGTRNVLPQLVNSIRMRQALLQKNSKLNDTENRNTLQFLRSTGPVQERRVESTEIKGRITHKPVNYYEKAMLTEKGFTDDTTSSNCLPSFQSVRVNAITYSTTAPSDRHKRDGSICVCVRDGEFLLCSITKLFSTRVGPVAIMNVFEQVDETILSGLRPPSSLVAEAAEAVNLSSHISTFIFAVKKSYKLSQICVKVSAIVSKCVLIRTVSLNYDFVVSIPNMFEYH